MSVEQSIAQDAEQSTAQAAEQLSYIEEKELVTIERIMAVEKHPNADKLYIAKIQGYNVIFNLQDMYPDSTPESIIGKLVIYFQIDSIIPEIFSNEPFYKLLESTYMGKKLRSIKLRGIISQGMMLDIDDVNRIVALNSTVPLNRIVALNSTVPLNSIVALKHLDLTEGLNLTNTLGVIKHYSIHDAEGPMYKGAYDRNAYKKAPSIAYLRLFPSFLFKTDQSKLQSKVKMIQKTTDRLYTTTVKFDGQSTTWFYYNGKVGVCSRNYEVLLEYEKPADQRDSYNNKFREMNEKYQILEKLTNLKKNIAIQAEMYGMAINCNRHKKNDVDIAVFDVMDLNTGNFMTYSDMCDFVSSLELPVIPAVSIDQPLLSENIEPWLELANQQLYDGRHQAEGIVVKTSDNKRPYISFKVISPEYLVKHKI